MTPLVEREREVAALAALLDALPAGEGRVAWIEGPAGIGKSTLLAEERRHAAEGDAQVLFARGSELEREFPFGVVRQLFEGVVTDPERRERVLAGAAAPAAAVFGDGGDGRGRRVVRRAARPVLARAQPRRRAPAGAGDRRPALVRPAVAALRRLPGAPARGPADPRRRDASAPASPAPTSRCSARSRTTRRPSPSGPVPLSADAVRALVRERLGAEADEPFCAACHAATGGNPLLLRQLLTALEADHVKPDAAHAGVVREIGPRAVSRTVLMRLARLSEDAIAVARAVAVLGESATLPAVAALTGLERGARGRRDRHARPRRDPAPRGAARRSCTRWSATPSTWSCRSASASSSTSARRACCSTPARRPSRSPPTSSPRRDAGRCGWPSSCARRAVRP